jgi:serine phosphatase RsbU (regulator of sigma subunit)
MVGGDWYDVVQVSPTAVVLCVGDVVGHDTNAAVGMGQLRNLIRAFVAEATDGGGSPDLPAILGRIDRIIYDDPSAWATCVIALLDTARQTIRWVNAGHPPMVLVRDGVMIVPEAAPGTMLGVTRVAERTVSEMQLFDGDRLLLFTDGLIERRGEPFDRSLVRLSDALWAHRDRPLDQICAAITDTLLEGFDQADDIAILVAEIGATEP